jgi:hypothetical protein
MQSSGQLYHEELEHLVATILSHLDRMLTSHTCGLAGAEHSYHQTLGDIEDYVRGKRKYVS